MENSVGETRRLVIVAPMAYGPYGVYIELRTCCCFPCVDGKLLGSDVYIVNQELDRTWPDQNPHPARLAYEEMLLFSSPLRPA